MSDTQTALCTKARSGLRHNGTAKEPILFRMVIGTMATGKMINHTEQVIYGSLAAPKFTGVLSNMVKSKVMESRNQFTKDDRKRTPGP